MLFNADDLHDLAQRLSGEHGSFSSSNLVNYGQTVILRPGSRTSMGVLLSGEAAGELLGEDYEVFPATLTYKPDVSSDGLDRLPVELVELESELDRLDDTDEQFGARGERIRNRYMRVVGRFRRYAIKAKRTGKPGPRRRAAALLRRIGRIYSKMQERGIETGGLPTPPQIRRQARRMLREFNRPSAPKAPDAVTPFELPAPPPAFGVEQDEADEELAADARAESEGYLFGGDEHDYFGISDDTTPSEYLSLLSEAERLEDKIDEDDDLEDAFGAGGDVLRGRYERLANRFRRFSAKASRKGTERSSSKTERLLNKIRKLYLKLQEKGIEVEGLTTPDELAEETAAFVMEAGEVKSKRRGRKARRSSADESQNEEEDAMFGVESAPFDFIDESEEIVFGLEAALEDARAALGLDEDLAGDDDDLSGDDEEDDEAEFKAFLEGEDDEDDFGDDEEGDEEEEAPESEDEPSVREARRAAKVARLEADRAKSELRRVRAERKAERLSGEDEDEDEDDVEDTKPSKAKGKAKAEDSEDEIPEDESDDMVAVQRSKLSKAAKQASAILSDPKSAEVVSDLSSALREAKRLLSTMDIRLKKGSKNGGIDYGRLRPIPRGGGSDGITVIAVRRRARNPQAAKVQAYAASFGMDSSGHMLDVYATDFLDRSGGYDALESMEAMQYATGPNDYLYGDEEFGQDMMGRMFRTRGRELRQQMPAMRSRRLLQVASNPNRSRRSRRAAMQELRARYGAQEQAAESQAEEIGYLFVTRGRELMDQMPELRSYRLYNIFSNPYRSERVRREALQTLAARYAEDNFGEDYGRMFRVRGRRAVSLVPQASSAKLLQVASNPYRSERVRAAAAAELAERHAAKQSLPAPVEVVPDPAAPQVVVQPTPITPATAPLTSSITTPSPAPAYVPVASPAFTQPAAPAPAPASAQPSAAYFQDQQALEREVAAKLPSYYAYDGSLNAYPFGEEAPLPPPRRSGPEVFA